MVLHGPWLRIQKRAWEVAVQPVWEAQRALDDGRDEWHLRDRGLSDQTRQHSGARSLAQYEESGPVCESQGLSSA